MYGCVRTTKNKCDWLREKRDGHHSAQQTSRRYIVSPTAAAQLHMLCIICPDAMRRHATVLFACVPPYDTSMIYYAYHNSIGSHPLYYFLQVPMRRGKQENDVMKLSLAVSLSFTGLL